MRNGEFGTMDGSRPRCTIITPTHNRHHFLRRLLQYFSEVNVSTPLVICDSSEPETLEANQRMVREEFAMLNAQHITDRGDMPDKCNRAVQRVETEYCVFCADDDFLMPQSVQECTTFLDQHPDHSCVSGIWLTVDTRENFRMRACRCYTLDSPDPLKRCRQICANWFSTFYAVHRTSCLKQAWAATAAACDERRARVFSEIMLSQLSVLYGKFSVLPQLHYVFECHEGNVSISTPMAADPSAVVELYDRFEDALSQEIATTTGLGETSAQTFVRKNHGHLRAAKSPRRFQRTDFWSRKSRQIRHWLYGMRDRFSEHPTEIWQHRAITPTHSLLNSDSWQVAQRLLSDHPNGICTASTSTPMHSRSA